MKIGIDGRLWNETGVGRYIRNLVAELQKIDKENEYVLFVRSQDKERVQSSIINDQWSIKTADITWHTVAEQLRFGKLLEKEKLDLVHFPYFSVPIRFNGKFVLTIHDLILHHYPTGKASTKSWFVYWFKHQAYKFIIAKAAKKAVKIITVSNATKKEIVDHLYVSANKIEVTYEGIDTRIKSFDKAQDKNQELGIKNEGAGVKRSFANAQDNLRNSNYFLYVGNAYPHKNLERLIEAYAALQDSAEVGAKFSRASIEMDKPKQGASEGSKNFASSPRFADIKLILVGKDDFFYKRLKEDVRKLDLENFVLFKHEVTDEELASLYKNALALVMPSLMEGFGLPVVEAMAQKCTVALSDIPVFHEIAQDVGIYFDPTHIQSIKNVLESIAKGTLPHDKERKDKGLKITQNFSWEKMAQQTLAVYKSSVGL